MKRTLPTLLEHALYGDDLDALERFYTTVFGLQVIRRVPGRLVALRCANAALLLFDPARSRTPGEVPHHGALGAGHIAFVMPEGDREAWRARLAAHGVAIEREVEWPEGGTSLYLRDPAGNSVELAPPGIWGGLGRELIDAGR